MNFMRAMLIIHRLSCVFKAGHLTNHRKQSESLNISWSWQRIDLMPSWSRGGCILGSFFFQNTVTQSWSLPTDSPVWPEHKRPNMFHVDFLWWFCSAKCCMQMSCVWLLLSNTHNIESSCSLIEKAYLWTFNNKTQFLWSETLQRDLGKCPRNDMQESKWVCYSGQCQICFTWTKCPSENRCHEIKYE